MSNVATAAQNKKLFTFFIIFVPFRLLPCIRNIHSIQFQTVSHSISMKIYRMGTFEHVKHRFNSNKINFEFSTDALFSLYSSHRQSWQFQSRKKFSSIHPGAINSSKWWTVHVWGVWGRWQERGESIVEIEVWNDNDKGKVKGSVALQHCCCCCFCYCAHS